MKISFVNTQLWLGGAETVVHQLYNGVTAAGHDAALYIANGKTYPRWVRPLYPRMLSRLGHSRFHSLVEHRFPRFTWTDRAFRAIADSDTEIVHIHNFHGNYATIESLAYLADRKPLVWSFHAFWGITGGCDHPRACDRYLAQCGQCPQVGSWPVGPVDGTSRGLAEKVSMLGTRKLNIVAPSRFVANTVAGSKVGRTWRIHHIPNGISNEVFGRQSDKSAARRVLGLPMEALIILSVNRDFTDPQKGHALVHHALGSIAPADAVLVLAGQNSAVAKAALDDRIPVVDAGYVTDRARLASLYAAADIFIFASPAENFPCVILEAMAAGCCVVATPSGGVVEQITHESDGLLADAIAPEALATALRRATADEHLRSRLASCAKQTVVRRFSESTMIENHLKLYEEICG